MRGRGKEITRKMKESERKERVKSDGAGERERGRVSERDRKIDRESERIREIK